MGHNRYEDSHELHIYMEFIPQSLYHVLQQCRQNSEIIREKNVLAASYAIARGVQYLHELDITAKANDIPNDIEIDITDFEIGHSVKVADIKEVYSNCTINHENEETIVMIDYVKVETDEDEDINNAEVSGDLS